MDQFSFLDEPLWIVLLILAGILLGLLTGCDKDKPTHLKPPPYTGPMDFAHGCLTYDGSKWITWSERADGGCYAADRPAPASTIYSGHGTIKYGDLPDGSYSCEGGWDGAPQDQVWHCDPVNWVEANVPISDPGPMQGQWMANFEQGQNRVIGMNITGSVTTATSLRWPLGSPPPSTISGGDTPIIPLTESSGRTGHCPPGYYMRGTNFANSFVCVGE